MISRAPLSGVTVSPVPGILLALPTQHESSPLITTQHLVTPGKTNTTKNSTTPALSLFQVPVGRSVAGLVAELAGLTGRIGILFFGNLLE